MHVLELYSGIGGLHYALEEIGLTCDVVAADINTVTNGIYKHNFPSTTILTRCIESLTVKELDKLSPDLIHMSPPCQPFTRVGKQQDTQDVRTKSFLHLIDVIPQMTKQPKYIFLENVKGFDTSETRTLLLESLTQHGYHYQEFLLSPLQFGIPNSRLRYYLMAKIKQVQFGFDTKDQIRHELPACAECYLIHKNQRSQQTVQTDKIKAKQSGQSEDASTPPLRDYSKNAESIHCEHSNITLSDISASGDNKASIPIRDAAEIKSIHNEHNNLASSAMTNVPVDQSNLSTGYSEGTSSEHKNSESGPKRDLTGIRPSPHDLSELSLSSASLDSDADSLPLYKRCQEMCECVGSYLEEGPAGHLETFMIPPKFLRHFWVMDIVKAESRNSCCFTKRYAHHMEGAGSVIQTAEPPGVDLCQYKTDRVYNEAVEEGVRSMKLRFFTPREIANLMCFPEHFEFPPEVSTIQCYRTLGNSLNVHVVAVLLRILLDDTSKP